MSFDILLERHPTICTHNLQPRRQTSSDLEYYIQDGVHLEGLQHARNRSAALKLRSSHTLTDKHLQHETSLSKLLERPAPPASRDDSCLRLN